MVTVDLLKPGKGSTVSFQAELLRADARYALVHARWERAALDLGYVVFEPGDHFYEHYYTDRWFTIFEIRSSGGALKGWYCNVARPAAFAAGRISSEDLEIDLFVPPDRESPLVLDLDEFEARDFATSDPSTYAAALAALDELRQMARDAAPPFG